MSHVRAITRPCILREARTSRVTRSPHLISAAYSANALSMVLSRMTGELALKLTGHAD